MKKFPKISAILVAMVLVLSFAGCSDGGSSNGDETVGGFSSGSGSGSGSSSGGSSSSGSGSSSGSSSSSGSQSGSESGSGSSSGGSSSSESGSGSSSGTSSTKNILAGKTYYSIDFEEVYYNSELSKKAKIDVLMFAFDSNGQKVKFTGFKYRFKDGAVKVDSNNTIDSGEFDYSVSGSTLTIKAIADGMDLIAKINSDGSIKDNDGFVMKKFKGNFYAIAGAEVRDENRLVAKAHIVIVDGAVCTYESHSVKCKLNANPEEGSTVANGTVSGNTLTFTFEEGGKPEKVPGSLSDKEIVIGTPEDGLTLKRM